MVPTFNLDLLMKCGLKKCHSFRQWWSTTWITGNNFNDKLYSMENDEKFEVKKVFGNSDI